MILFTHLRRRHSPADSVTANALSIGARPSTNGSWCPCRYLPAGGGVPIHSLCTSLGDKYDVLLPGYDHAVGGVHCTVGKVWPASHDEPVRNQCTGGHFSHHKQPARSVYRAVRILGTVVFPVANELHFHVGKNGPPCTT